MLVQVPSQDHADHNVIKCHNKVCFKNQPIIDHIKNKHSQSYQDSLIEIIVSWSSLSNLEMGARSFDDEIAQVKSRDRANW